MLASAVGIRQQMAIGKRGEAMQRSYEWLVAEGSQLGQVSNAVETSHRQGASGGAPCRDGLIGHRWAGLADDVMLCCPILDFP